MRQRSINYLHVLPAPGQAASSLLPALRLLRGLLVQLLEQEGVPGVRPAEPVGVARGVTRQPPGDVPGEVGVEVAST